MQEMKQVILRGGSEWPQVAATKWKSWILTQVYFSAKTRLFLPYLATSSIELFRLLKKMD